MKISARYEVLGLLGQGGMGVVYHVRDTTRGRENALKTLAPGRSDDIVERFLTEAQVMFRLEHDNIVRVYDFGKDGETYFLTMELIRGKNLRQLLNARQNKGFSLAEVIRMGIETADALNYAHSQKPEAVVHRDIKPVNIMVEEESGRVVVTDFGIAKLMADAGGGETQVGSDLSRTVFAGTVPYSAPEQFLSAGGGRRLDARVDIYALGVVLFEIYTGRHFFAGLSADEVELHHRSIESGPCPVKTPHACDHKVVLPDTPESFVRVLERAIARNRSDRYRTAGEMLADLQACAASASIEACASARSAAESAGALDISPTEFKRGDDLREQAHAAQAEGDHAKAGELFRGAMQAFSSAASQAGDRAAQQNAQQAKAAMQAVARDATDRDTGSLAPDPMRQAAQLVATAEAAEAQGQWEQAAGLYRQAEDAFRTALAAAEQARARREIEAELPALRAAREQAEEVDAATLAADAFANAVREQVDLEEALAAGELARARELLPKARDGFASAADEAKRRLTQSVDEARAAMRAVAAEAVAADAPTSAKAAYIEAETLAGAAEKLVERGQLELAVAQLGRATDAYRTAATAAARAAERALLEKELPAIRAARADAEKAEAPALATEAFDAAAADQAALEAALAAGELTKVRELLPKVGAAFAAATSAAHTAQAGRAAAAARATMIEVRDAAVAAGAEKLTPDALTKARAREKDAAGAEQRQDWSRAEKLYGEAAKAFEDVRATALRRGEEQRLATALAEARSAAETARARAKELDAPKAAADAYGEGVALAKKAAGAANDAAGMTAATADYERAAERFEAAAAEAERVHRREELEAALAAVEEARAQALEAGAGRHAEFSAAADELAAAQRALAADELSLVVSSAATARDRFAAAKVAAERSRAEQAADATLAEVAARAAEAGEAGAESLAAATWSRATATQKDALTRRHAGDPDAVMPLAAEALQHFTTALEEATEAAHRAAATAREAATLAGADEKQIGTPEKGFATGEQRRTEGQLVAAAVAYRKATTAFEAATKSRADAAQKAEASAAAARRDAEEVDAATHGRDEYGRAVTELDGATKALAAKRFRAAEVEFEKAAEGFRAAAKTAARERKRAASLAARKAADDAREKATAAKASELAVAELKRATDAYGTATKALESESFADAEKEFGKARDLFERAREAAVDAAAARETDAARKRVEQLRASRAAAATGFFARRKLAKADAVVAEGTAAVASRDFAAATKAFTEAAALFEAMPAAATPAAETPKPAAAPPAPAAKGKGKKPAPLSEATQLGDGATVVTERPAFGEATAVASAPALQDATVVASGADAATKVGRAVPVAAPAPARGLPVPYIAAAIALLLVVGAVVYMLRGTEEQPQQKAEAPKATATPKQVAKVEPTTVPQAPPPPAQTAAAPAPTAAAAPPPRIASVAPEALKVAPAGDTQQFRIALADPAGATYAWSVDGKTLDASTANATVPVTAAPQKVTVVARTAGGEARHEWELASIPAKPSPQAPTVSIVAPTLTVDPSNKAAVQVQPGKSRRFSVKAKTEAGAQLKYAWTVDGKSVGGNTASYELSAESDDEGASRRVRVEVSAGGPVAAEEWNVTVPLGAVTITRQSPSTASVQNEIGDATDFTVDARAGRGGATGLDYRWTVNKRPVDGDGGRFTYRADRAGTADVEVRVEAPDRQAAVQKWTVRTRDAQPQVQPTEVVALAPRATSTPARTAPVAGDARRELEGWIASYRDAYQQKNVDRLVSLGVLKSENRDRLETALKDLDDLKVSIASSSIDVQGPDSAVVTLTREDSFKAGGRTQTQSINIKKTLRKVNGTWVAQ